MARPLACLLAAAALLAVAFPTSALAAPKTPSLLSSSPPSPGAALRPYIQGDAEGGVVISSIGSSVATRLGPVARAAENPTFLITIYTEDPTCSLPGAIAAEGTAAELEDPGIQVDQDVKAGAETIFFAKQTDLAEPGVSSGCSNGYGYRHVDGPPAPPAITATDPSSPAGDNFPNLIGTAPMQTSVSIYDNASCSGIALATGGVTTFEKQGIEVAVADNTITTFHARSHIAGYTSTCSSSSVTYEEVSTSEGPGGEDPGGQDPGGGDPGPKAPDPKGRPAPPTLRTEPGYAANDNTPIVTGKAPGAAKVEIYGSAGCKGPVLARGSASEFTGPGFELQVANDMVVAFYGVSIDGGDDRSHCSEEPAVYIEDSTAPRTRITSGPAAKTRKRKAVFRFADISGDPATTNFVCKLDRRQWKACSAPLKLKGLTLRRHVFKVKAVDTAGNVEQGVAKRRFRVVRDY